MKLSARVRKVAFTVRLAGFFLFVVAAGTLFSSEGVAQTDQPSEYEVKAAFLFNFTKFVEWPDGSFGDPHSPIVIGIIGDDRRGDDLRRCHILFISDSERLHTTQILAGLRDASILTVSDVDGFAVAGGVMQFVMQGNRVHFVVNLDAATQSKLRVSAKLLALAQLVSHSQATR